VLAFRTTAPKPHPVILSTAPTKFVPYTLAVETAGYLYKVPLRALYLSDNNFVGLVLSVAKDQVGRPESTTFRRMLALGALVPQQEESNTGG
jgi:hypothetical protein